MRKLLLFLTVAAIVAAMVAFAIPASAQSSDDSGTIAQAEDKEKKEKEKKKDKEKKEKDKEKKAKDKEKKAKEEKKEITEVPSSGGIPLDTVALFGLGAGILIVGGGLLARKILR